MPDSTHNFEVSDGPITISETLAAQASRSPDAIAICALERAPLTFADLHAQLAKTAAELHSMGIARNDRVAIVLPNGAEMAVAFLAIAACATTAPLNPSYRKEEYEFYLSDLGARAIVLPAGSDSPARTVAEERGIPVIELTPLMDGPAGIFALSGKASTAIISGGFAGLDDIALILHTSGTTSKPKIVPLTQRNICTSSRAVLHSLKLTSKDRCLNVMPLFHVHGLISAVTTSLCGGASVVCTPGFQAPSFFDWVREFRPTWYTAVPTTHQAILQRAQFHEEVIAQCPLRFIRSASSALPVQVMTELERIFNTPVIEAYGMTEATHQITGNPMPPMKRKQGSVGIAGKTEVAIMDDVGNLLSEGQVGEIVIRGPSVMNGYENNPEANQKAFTNGWFRTGDQGYLDGENYLFITGRIKELINRGGEKVSPREVDEVLFDHPAIAQAVTFAMPDSKLGEDVAAAVVLQGNVSAEERDIRAYAASRLADFKVPRRIFILKEIPKGPTGKIQRIGLAEKLGVSSVTPETSAMRPEYIPPRTPSEEGLAALWSKILRVEQIGVRDDFFQIGGDSILATQLVSRIRETFRVDIPLISIFDEAATVEKMAAIIEGKEHEAECATSPKLQAVSRKSDMPLSFVQERLWFLHQYNPECPVYNSPVATRLTGALDISALNHSLDEIIRRHDVLRATFPDAAGGPRQIIFPPWHLKLEEADLTVVPESEREKRARELLRKEFQRPFDLARGPLFRGLLVKLSQCDHVLLLVAHHIIFDGWSASILRQELSAIYEATISGKKSPLPELAVQYPDFAAWQRELLQGAVLDDHLSYWKRRLSGVPPVLALPTDQPCPATRTYSGAHESLMLPKSLADALKNLSSHKGVTLFMTLLAAFKILLHRYTGRDDIVVGAPVAGRTRVEVEPLIGCFINALVLRTDLSGNPTLDELLRRVRETALGAYQHQDMPFEKLVTELRPNRQLNHAPLFQASFQLRNMPRPSNNPTSLKMEEFPFETGTALSEVSMDVTDTPSGLACVLEYNTDLFNVATAKRMFGHFQTLLQAIANGDTTHRISGLSLLTDTERRQIFEEWNNTQTDFPQDKLVHELIEEQARRTPHNIALFFQDQRVSYEDLDARANRLAHYLRSRGVTPETSVAICLTRGVDMVVAMLAVLKSGGAYVPLDPKYPQSRLEYMLRDSRAPYLITHDRLRLRLSRYTGDAICLDRDAELLAAQRDSTPERILQPENLAYVIYTSGSTGSPKGTLITHRSVVNYLSFISHACALDERDITLQVPSFSWDSSVRAILSPLTVGASLVVSTDEEAADPEALLQHVERHRVSAILSVTPSLLNVLTTATSRKPVRLESLRLIISSGEALFAGDYRKAQSAFGRGVLFVNHYGPTECTCSQIYFPIHELDSNGIVPIGRLAPNHQAYILDRTLNPVPIGVSGELHIGGVGLARGYLNRRDLTDEKFIPNPFSNDPNARLYKTGDIARFRPDGNIEFLGRLDHQVKIRGYRIELQEIESALKENPLVTQAVVTAREDSPGEKHLVAYVVPSGSETPAAHELRNFLVERLPDYMIPSSFVILDALPLTPRGKIDREALPPSDRRIPQSRNAFAPPRTPIEKSLAEIWAEELGINRVGIHDNFFDLGGHSLRAAKLMYRVRDAFRVDMPLRTLFESPCIADLALAVIQCLAGNKSSETTRILAEMEPPSNLKG